MSREISWLDMVVRAEPDHYRISRYVVEYEFTSHGHGSDYTHENGYRVFRGNYDQRGPYAVDPSDLHPFGLVWNGRPIEWGGENLTWDD